MEKLSAKIAVYFIEENIIKEDEYEICQYGLFVLLNNVLVCTTVILISIIIKMHIETAIYLFVFCSLRSYTGGYHANTVKGCHLLTFLGYFIIMVQINFFAVVVADLIFWMILSLSTYFICFLQVQSLLQKH